MGGGQVTSTVYQQGGAGTTCIENVAVMVEICEICHKCR